MSKMKLGFLGFGNLAKALVTGFSGAGDIVPSDVTVLTKTEQSMNEAVKNGFNAAGNLTQLLTGCDTFVIAVKPYVFDSLADEIKSSKKTFKHTVSVMAGVKAADIEKITETPFLRVIPTLAAEKRSDIIGIYGEENTEFEKMLSRIGVIMRLDEEKLAKFTVAASCGLGFAARVLDRYADAVEELGFDRTEAEMITAGIFTDASVMKNWTSLAGKVATKGGVTERGLGYMDENNFNGFFKEVFNASLKK